MPETLTLEFVMKTSTSTSIQHIQKWWTLENVSPAFKYGVMLGIYVKFQGVQFYGQVLTFARRCNATSFGMVQMYCK